ncbi:phosphate acetyltransferase [Corynebacterium epidermidicanis]|uniref:Phosphate acetyltransferase n=1 Tax=Corynebacterium epidermidicanis TaxID=1050174 RepID=A0A0G3GRR0_9CORY|nr:phosphate acetyltransferase [Corynebacterium epidermidicanis]AKK02223.1 phosphate acetyltransferase [Corynebacterium epidermidicanis]
MTNETKSVLLTTVGRTLDGFDADAFAAQHGLKVAPLTKDRPDLAEILAAQPLADGPKLLIGTGSIDFDAKAAAALGVGLLLLHEANATHVDLSVAHAEELGAQVLATFHAGEEVSDEVFQTEVEVVMCAEVFQNWLLESAKKANAHIVLPEGEDDRILQAAHYLLADDTVRLTILGEPTAINKRAQELGLDLSKATIVDHLTDPRAEEFAADFAELRKKKGVTLEEAQETMKDISYYATMMIHKGLADGMVSGAAHTTAHTIKPSFQIIKTVPGASVVSSIFLMVMRGRLWAFGDCAVNPNPTADQLGEIAVVSAKTAAQFGIDPRVAMLSYSTGTSGSGPDVDRCAAAVAKARELDPELKVDGPLQFDASVDMGVAAKKMPGSEVAGQANVFIFPDLEAGNIGYKTAQRTGHALAVGPILQGLNKPVNDLSRGATVSDIINTVAITAIQAGTK